MRNIATIFCFGLFLFVLLPLPNTLGQTVIYSEDFESGSANAGWGTFYKGEDNLVAKPMAQAPKVLTGGGNYVGWLQDIDGTYTGAAVAINGAFDLKDYSIEADVYCYVGQSLSAYTGLVVYADTTKRDFYKMRADFDASDRINFSGLKSDPNTFLPLFSKDFKGVNNPGVFPVADGWHKMKIEISGTTSTQTSISCYFDGNLLSPSPIIDTSSNRAKSGFFGFYTFQMDADGIAGYFDNIVVTSLVTSIDEKVNTGLPEGFSLQQNYPNPFNPETQIDYHLATSNFVSLTINDLLGRQIKTLVSEIQPSGSHSVKWNGNDEYGNSMPAGVYFFTLKAGTLTESKKMILLK